MVTIREDVRKGWVFRTNASVFWIAIEVPKVSGGVPPPSISSFSSPSPLNREYPSNEEDRDKGKGEVPHPNDCRIPAPGVSPSRLRLRRHPEKVFLRRKISPSYPAQRPARRWTHFFPGIDGEAVSFQDRQQKPKKSMPVSSQGLLKFFGSNPLLWIAKAESPFAGSRPGFPSQAFANAS